MSSGVRSSSSIRGSAKEWSVSGCWNSFKLTFKNADVEHEYVDAHDTQSVKNCRPLIPIVCTVISVLFVLGVSNPSNAHRLQWQHYATTPFFVVLLFVNARLLLRTQEAQRRLFGYAVSPSRAIAILFIECIACITLIAILWNSLFTHNELEQVAAIRIVVYRNCPSTFFLNLDQGREWCCGV